jgi:RHS repeat-associated protein
MTIVSANTYNALQQVVRDMTWTNTMDDACGADQKPQGKAISSVSAHGEVEMPQGRSAGPALHGRNTGSSAHLKQRAFVPFQGRVLAEYYGGSTRGTLFDHPDELGSLTTATDYATSHSAERLFYPFGELWQGADFYSLNPHQTFAQLPDYDNDSGTDLYNTLNRHYTPMGRWLSPDPGGLDAVKLDDPQTWNMYAYVRNNPTTFTDPTGLDLWERGCGKETATCHKNYVGSYNDKGKFVRTTIQSDANGNFQGHTVNFNSSGIHVDSKYEGVFASGTAATVVNGAGTLSGFRGTFSTNCLGTCAAGGRLDALPGHSFSELLPTLRGPNESWDKYSFTHQGAQYRGGNFATPDLHLSYAGGNGPQSMHLDWRYPFGSDSGFNEHAGDLILYETRSKVLGWTSDPPDEYVHPSDEP